MQGATRFEDVAIDLLVPHPENSNFMGAEMLGKLRRHVERTGRYEPLTVRPHPWEPGKYQVINGHNRLRVLRALNFETVRCSIWDLDDAQSRLYLATLNRLSGREIPERRSTLLENLLAEFNADDLFDLLPDDRKQIEELRHLIGMESTSVASQPTVVDQASHVPVILDFIVDESQAKQVNLALDLILHARKDDLSRSGALVQLAGFYLQHCGPTAHD